MKKIYLFVPPFAPILFWMLLTTTTLLMLVELAPKHGGWPYWDKVQHASIFMMLTLTGSFVFQQKKTWMVIGLISYGAATELLQGMFTLTRLASINDWLADTTGVVIGLLILVLVKKLSPAIKPHVSRI